MSMSKKDFIALAKVLQRMDVNSKDGAVGFGTVVGYLADFCETQNPNFKRERWFDYIGGKCGPNGDKIKPQHVKEVSRVCVCDGGPSDIWFDRSMGLDGEMTGSMCGKCGKEIA